MFFRDIPGKSAEKERLLASIREEKVAHAQLFLGRSGNGQLGLALAYVSYLFCQDRTPEDSCGVCSACIKTHKYIHPDMHFAFPVVKKDGKERKETTSTDFLVPWRAALLQNPFMDIKSWMRHLSVENGQANINVKECFDIIKKLGLKTFESEYKVLILWMPEYLRNEGNRLLKLIEEPPENTTIILVAESQEEILNTILSRTQLVKVSPFLDDEIKSYLGGKYELSEDQLNSIAGLAAGDLNHGIHLANEDSASFSESLLSWLRIAYKMEPVEMGAWVGEMAKWGREQQKHFLEYGLHYFREYIIFKMTGRQSQRLNAGELESVQKMANLLDIQKTENIISVLNDCIGHVSRNANPKILFMTESLRIGRIMRGIEIEDGIYQI